MTRPRKPDPLPPVIKVPSPSFPAQLATPLAPQATIGDEILRLLRSIDKSLKTLVARKT